MRKPGLLTMRSGGRTSSKSSKTEREDFFKIQQDREREDFFKIQQEREDFFKIQQDREGGRDEDEAAGMYIYVYVFVLDV